MASCDVSSKRLMARVYCLEENRRNSRPIASQAMSPDWRSNRLHNHPLSFYLPFLSYLQWANRTYVIYLVLSILSRNRGSTSHILRHGLVT